MCSDGSTTAAQYRTDENDARNWQSTTGKANAATPDTANAPPCQPYNPYKPPDARNEHTREKMPPQRPSQRHRRATRHDEQDDVHATTLPAYRYDDETPLPACRYDRQNVQNAATNTAARSTTRRHGMHGGTNRQRNEGQKKTSRPAKLERLAKRDDERYDSYSPSPSVHLSCPLSSCLSCLPSPRRHAVAVEPIISLLVVRRMKKSGRGCSFPVRLLRLL